MINEISHVRVTFASFATSIPPADQWIAWHYRNLDRAYATLACERSEDGTETWRCIDTSLTRVNSVLYEAFKKGALYEAEIGVRLVRGQKLSAERYLGFVDGLQGQDVSGLSGRVLATAKFPAGNMAQVVGYDRHRWDHSRSAIVETAEGIQVDIPLDTAEALAFVEVACDRVELCYERTAGVMDDENNRRAQPQETAELFA
ncbi:hypothetical protein [Acidovorax sp. sic0104]|uniref:hypothetical protein n=1 Tax=Acidovorax sp. sic0104 TaxID=2854784 RepID=UPI001C462B15|nr:hypothetical protein [Acidovorax sp. sic0104]MBV7541931.1 hypothetical protein [Acidovorax sp. sic0104]